MIPVICPCCGTQARFSQTSAHIYRHDYGPVYECASVPACDASVGAQVATHENLVECLAEGASVEEAGVDVRESQP
jgi:hypothetical protein